MLRGAPRRAVLLQHTTVARTASARVALSRPARNIMPRRCFSSEQEWKPLRISSKDMLDGMDNIRRLYRKYRPVRVVKPL